jgi:hypothetical protein
MYLTARCIDEPPYLTPLIESGTATWRAYWRTHQRTSAKQWTWKFSQGMKAKVSDEKSQDHESDLKHMVRV